MMKGIKIIVIIIFCILPLGCIKSRNKSELTIKDLDYLKGYFYDSNYDTKLSHFPFHDLKIGNLNVGQLTELYGEPFYQRCDTFRYGNVVNFKPDYENADTYLEYYGWFDAELILAKYPVIVIHVYRWALDVRWALECYCISLAEDDCLNPFGGYLFEYSIDWIPFECLHEKNMSVNQISMRYGEPIEQSVDTFYFGVKNPFYEDGEIIITNTMEVIDSLRRTPKELVHTFTWSVDSIRVLKMNYLENDVNFESSKPVGGFQCNIDILYLE